MNAGGVAAIERVCSLGLRDGLVVAVKPSQQHSELLTKDGFRVGTDRPILERFLVESASFAKKCFVSAFKSLSEPLHEGSSPKQHRGHGPPLFGARHVCIPNQDLEVN